MQKKYISMKNSPFYETLDGRAAITNRLQLIKDNSLTGRNYERNKNECPLIVPSKHELNKCFYK